MSHTWRWASCRNILKSNQTKVNFHSADVLAVRGCGLMSDALKARQRGVTLMSWNAVSAAALLIFRLLLGIPLPPFLRKNPTKSEKKIRLLNKQRTLRCDTITQWPWRNPAGPASSHQRWPLARGALKRWHATISNDHLCDFKWIKRSGVQSQPSFQKWQGNISIDLNGDYKIKRQVLNVSLKASLKSVIAKMDSFCAVKKRESCYSLLLLSQATWELHKISEERPNAGKKDRKM